jgi:hypothetical protein
MATYGRGYTSSGLKSGWEKYDSFDDYWKDSGLQTQSKYKYVTAPDRMGFSQIRRGDYVPTYVKQQLKKDFEIGKATQEYQKAYDEAKQANLQRYEDILSGRRDTEKEITGQRQDILDNVLSQIGQYSQQERQDLDRRYDSLRAQSMRGLVDSGLVSSTIAPAVRRGVAESKSADVNRLNDAMIDRRLRYEIPLRQDIANYKERSREGTYGFMERRKDSYPDANKFNMLMQKYGRYGGYKF